MNTADSLRTAWQAFPPSWPAVVLVVWMDVRHVAFAAVGGLVTGWLALPQPNWRRRADGEKTPPPAALGDP